MIHCAGKGETSDQFDGLGQLKTGCRALWRTCMMTCRY
jgi:hypothetical protein